MVKKLLFWIFVFVLLINNVLASNSGGYLDIIYPSSSIYPDNLRTPQGRTTVLPFDVLNYSYYKLNSSNTNCSFLMFNNVGTVISNGSLSYDSSLKFWFYELNINETKNYGEFNYYVFCNTSLGEYNHGYLLSHFKITPSGYEGSLGEARIASLVILILLSLIVLCVVVGIVVDGRNEFTMGGDLVKISVGKYVKLACFLFGYFFFWLLTFFVWQTSKLFLLFASLTTILETIFILTSYLFIPFILIITILLIIKVILDAELHKLSKRGLRPRK